MSEVRWLRPDFDDFPHFDHMGEPPANLKRVEATGQNTLALHDGEPVHIRSPRTGGGPDVWTWQVMNIGPGICFVRWDGRGYAKADDENSLRLQAGFGYADIRAGSLTMECDGATFVTFTAQNIGRG